MMEGGEESGTNEEMMGFMIKLWDHWWDAGMME